MLETLWGVHIRRFNKKEEANIEDIKGAMYFRRI